MDALIRRERLISESKVRGVFTPFSPIHKSELLSGREAEISSILSSLNTPGQHALIYGNRGIGKSSLANVISKLAKDSLNYSVYIKKCSSEDSFTSLVSVILEPLGYDVRCTESVKEHSEGAGAKLGVGLFGGNIGSNRKKTDKIRHDMQFSSPSWAAKALKDSCSLLIIDEADMLDGDEEKLKLAEFIKHLSDYESSLKVLVVGISSTGRDLVCNHRSLERCLNEISLQPIGIKALRNIVESGANELELNFDSDVIDDIVDISGGYPHFVHLIALKCAEEAIVAENKHIVPTDLNKALGLAAKFSEGNLKRAYEAAIRKNTENSRKVLLAAALCHSKGFLVSELVEMTNQVIDSGLRKSTITNCLSRWVKSDQIHVIVKVERGHYRFSDPRFMSYVKMVSGFTYDTESIVADILKSEYSKRYVSDH
ncbi:ATP-binding protein [Neptunomonas phycophila]|uniref:ATP-binding protein n=1 Tax=Neptunomonas phycophila TaxID=1572645 RepID=A0AAW7XGG1_9GAMM|nr:ATP-binding protein [Neptunomonas phycophila]MDO6451965.1 ATP-binding protein [Neptunomonas phycophila]